jgi:arylsulfatase A-like enzyme
MDGAKANTVRVAGIPGARRAALESLAMWRGTLAVGTCLALLGCGPGPGPARDLLADLAEADLRADSHDLAGLAGDPLFERRGWAPVARSARGALAWTQGLASRLRLPLHSTGDKELRLVVRAHESLAPALPLRVSLNGVEVGRTLLGVESREIRMPLPGSAQVPGDNVLELEVPRHREPDAADADQRLLAVGVTALSVTPLGGGGAVGLPTLEGAALALPSGSSASWYLRAEPGSRLQLRSRQGATGLGLLAVRAATDTGEAVVRPAGPAGGSEGLELGVSPGTPLRLELSNPGAGLVWIEEIELRLQALHAPPPKALPLERPDLLVYVVDTLRADRLGLYGDPRPTSPRLDAFAKRALVFEDAWAQASWTRPATASMLTGLHPAQHGALRETQALAPDQVTLAELLAAQGYRCGAFVANHLVGGRYGFDQGFHSWNAGDPGLYGASASELGERALEWLDAGEGPSLLYLHTMEPHSPYDPPADAMAPFELPGYQGDRDTRALLRLGQLGELSEQGLAFLEARYAGEIRTNDAAFGELLDALERRGRLERTLVVFVSDHGEELLDHGGTEHAKTLYQELLRVPLLVGLPGSARRAERIPDPVQQIDLLPTLLGLLALDPPPGLPGRDLSARWLGQAAEARPPPLLFAEERFTVTDKLAVRSGSLKLILNNDGTDLWRGGTHVELYDLAEDAAEGRNLVGARPVGEAFLRQELERFRRRHAERSAEAAPLELTPEELEQLRALGYVQ